MIGAIIGDIVGSRFEFNNIKTKEFEFYHPKCEFTDDSVMTLAIASALLKCDGDFSKLQDATIGEMQSIGRKYPECGYGMLFYNWIFSSSPEPYNSLGNGSAMRVSSVAYVARSEEEVKELSRIVTAVSHDHPEGIKGAEATAVAVYMALHGSSIDEIRQCIDECYYPMDFTLDEIRPDYRFNEICQDTVPQAIMAFLESISFEDAIRNAISIGGDSDTLGAITGAIAAAYYGVPQELRDGAAGYLSEPLKAILFGFENKYPAAVCCEKKEF